MVPPNRAVGPRQAERLEAGAHPGHEVSDERQDDGGKHRLRSDEANHARNPSSIAETSTLNCSANSLTTDSTSDFGPPTASSAGSGGNDSARPQVCRTSAVMRPSPGANATKALSTSRANELLRLAHRRHVKVIPAAG